MKQLEHEIDRLKERVRRVAALEELTVPGAARLLKKTPEWVRKNLPVIVHNGHKKKGSHKGGHHHVRIADIEAYQARRRQLPELGN